MKKLNGELGKEIQRIRKLKGYTQAQLAETTGLTGNYIGYLERGEQLPSIKTLNKISSVLGITVGFLFSSAENSTLKARKPWKSDEKTILINKLSNRLKKYSTKNIQFVLAMVKRMSSGS